VRQIYSSSNCITQPELGAQGSTAQGGDASFPVVQVGGSMAWEGLDHDYYSIWFNLTAV
jgi:hypothetical protein